MADDRPTSAELPTPGAADGSGGNARTPARSRRTGQSEALVGQTVGPYTLLSVLGEGGMGVVYLAEQERPVRRRVALKLVRPGLDSEAVLARFAAERDALALMEHPAIATVLDAGTTDDGRPFFAMEYVPGIPITRHCDEHRLSVSERIGLFLRVCEGVQHAHQKGLIHRDLKPSNVLVTYADGNAEPKIIDFGVAKAVHRQIGDTPLFTEHGQLIGTPEYMSPEQASGSRQDIDTRSDVYALGVMLYELLAGRLPFEPEELRKAGIEEMHRIIRDVDPPRPSLRVTLGGGTTSAQIDEVSRLRRTDTRALSRALKSDLDWAVMRCLEKDRSRRYDSVGALADELRRFLRREPLEAGPPTLMYRARKLAGRHRGAVASAAAVSAALIAGLAVSLVQWRQAESARASAEVSERQTVELTGRVIEALNETVAVVPGTLGARDRFAALTAEHLERLERRVGVDPASMLMLADAYDALGDARGGLRGARTGDLRGAAEAVAEAISWRERALAGAGTDNALAERARRGLAASALRLGDLAREQGRLDDASEQYERGLTLLDGLGANAQREPAVVRLRSEIGVALANALGRLVDAAPEQVARRVALLDDAVRELDALVAIDPTPTSLWALGRAQHAQGLRSLFDEGDASRSVGLFERAAETFGRAFEMRPYNGVFRRYRAGSLFFSGESARQIRRWEQAAAALGAAREEYGFLLAADPADADARIDLARTLESLTPTLRLTGNPEGSIDSARRGIRLLEGRADDEASQRTLVGLRYQLASTLVRTGAFSPAAVEASGAYRDADRADERWPPVARRSATIVNIARVWSAAIAQIEPAARAGLPAAAQAEAALSSWRATADRWDTSGRFSEDAGRLREVADTLERRLAGP